MLQCFNGRGVGWEFVGLARPEEADHLGAGCGVRSAVQDQHPAEPLALDLPRRLPNPRVVARTSPPPGTKKSVSVTLLPIGEKSRDGLKALKIVA